MIPMALRRYLQQRRRNEARPRWHFPDAFMASLGEAVNHFADGVTIVHPWPDGAHWAFVLTHDVESEFGLSRSLELADVEREFGFLSCWNIVPHGYPVDQGVIRELRSRGCEIGVHGYNHDGRLFSSRKEFDRRAVEINRAMREYGAVGFRAPMVHRQLDWMQQLEIEYDASHFDIDPFQAMPGGVGAVWPFLAGRFVELPYTLPQDHTLLIVLGENDDRLWREKLEWIVQRQGMVLMLTHPDYLAGQHGLDLYRRFLEHVCELSGYWHALPRDVAEWWRQRHDSHVEVDGEGHRRVAGPAAGRCRVAVMQSDGERVLFNEPQREVSWS
ncbi:MAG: hypothetical protein KDA63_13825 [Planctomycetales bacterium]|nr:hypothetical protein [Planctomycetales bacterium]